MGKTFHNDSSEQHDSGRHSLPLGRAGVGPTIIIPVFNRKAYISKTLDSIPDTFKVIVVDNGSTDGSYEFCRMYMLNNHRKNMIVEREFTPGACAARNKGLSLCKTEWVYFFDSDDLFTGIPTSWNEDKDLVCFPVCQQIHGKMKVRTFEPVGDAHVHILNSMLCTQSMIFRTEWLRNIGGWNNDCHVWQDWELGLRALLHKPRLQWITDKAFNLIFVHDDSITGGSFSEKYKERLDTLEIAFRDICDLTNEDMKCMFALFLRSYIFSGQLIKEGNEDARKEVTSFIYERFQTNKMSHKLGRLLQWYVSKGGRGAWKIALKVVG